MGLSFLTHDEKSSQSPSPDLLQFNGGVSQRRFFGSLSSVKETSVSSSSRSPLESTDSERNLHVASCLSSPRSPPPPIVTTDESTYSSLIPSPIQPGNVHRLREKFMDFELKRRNSIGEDRERVNTVSRENNNNKNEAATTISELDCRFINRPATTSPYVSFNRGSRRRGGTLPASARSRSSLHALSPSSRNAFNRNRSSLPTSSTAYEKLDVIRSDNDLSDCLRQMTLGAGGNNIPSFTSETPLVRHRPRARPHVPQPRSVIIRAGYLPVVQTVDVISTRPKWTTNESTGASGAAPTAAAAAANADVVDTSGKIQDLQNRSSNECLIASNNVPKNDKNNRIIREDPLLKSSCSTSTKPNLEESDPTHVVTNQGDHTVEKKVLTKDAEINTSAEVLVLPKGTKTSVLLKSTLSEVVDGKAVGLKRKKKKRGIARRLARTFGRIMIRLVELF